MANVNKIMKLIITLLLVLDWKEEHIRRQRSNLKSEKKSSQVGFAPTGRLTGFRNSIASRYSFWTIIAWSLPISLSALLKVFSIYWFMGAINFLQVEADA